MQSYIAAASFSAEASPCKLFLNEGKLHKKEITNQINSSTFLDREKFPYKYWGALLLRTENS